jgi:putative acetyltransferase
MVVVRRAVPDDAEAILVLYQRSIRETAAAHEGYDAAQLEVWSAGLTLERVKYLIAETVVLVATDEEAAEGGGTALAGFVNLETVAGTAESSGQSVGELDMLFVSPDFGGRGVGTLLVAEIEQVAARQQLGRVRVDASLLAAPLFERLHYVVDERYTKAHGGQEFPNTWLSKTLG